MTISDETLWNYSYTPRFVTMPDVKELKLNIAVLVGVGDTDELFDIDRVKEFYNLAPGKERIFCHEMQPMQNTR